MSIRAPLSAGRAIEENQENQPKWIDDVGNNMNAFTVVRADSHEAAARLFDRHPHFSIFPGDSVEIMPVLPIRALSRSSAREVIWNCQRALRHRYVSWIIAECATRRKLTMAAAVRLHRVLATKPSYIARRSRQREMPNMSAIAA